MTLPEKLAIGTLKLEGTDLAVDSGEAPKLLPLWKAVRALNTSQTISNKEMDSLYGQIEGVMTAEQVRRSRPCPLPLRISGNMMADLGVDLARADWAIAIEIQTDPDTDQRPEGGFQRRAGHDAWWTEVASS